MSRADQDLTHMRAAARVALRGHGGAEPNPLVGCVVVCPAGAVVGWGYHRVCGGPHAEIEALRRAASRAAGATMYCTLEPCCHTGRTGPCTEAIIKARIGRVIVARWDPNPVAAGGLDHLRAAGIDARVDARCEQAIALSDPFAQRVRSGRPWVVAKWAQTIDGRLALRPGAGRWISNAASRRMVHRERGRVDAILTGIGTVLKDDPLLTARDVRVRHVANRIVIDPSLDTPLDARIVTTAQETGSRNTPGEGAPTSIVCDELALHSRAAHAARLAAHGVQVIPFPARDGELPLESILRELATRFDCTNVLVEAGPGLLGRLLRQRLVNEAWVFIAPMLAGSEADAPTVHDFIDQDAGDSSPMTLRLLSRRTRQGDVILRYRVDAGAPTAD